MVKFKNNSRSFVRPGNNYRVAKRAISEALDPQYMVNKVKSLEDMTPEEIKKLEEHYGAKVTNGR